MTETIEQEIEIVMDESGIRDNPINTDPLIAIAEFGLGSMVGFTASDLAGDKLVTMQKQFFIDNPLVWWAIPVAKGILGGLLIFGGSKMLKESADVARFTIGIGAGVFADVINDLITALEVDKTLGIERDIEIVILPA